MTGISMPYRPRILRRAIPGALKRLVRRHANRLFLTHELIEYQAWLKQRMLERKLLYTDRVEPGLFSVLTPVWDGSPVPYLNKLAASLIEQNPDAACEWVCSITAVRNRRSETIFSGWLYFPG